MKATNPSAVRRLVRSQGSGRRVYPVSADRVLRRLKGRLLRRMLGETDNPRAHAALRRAAAEAESLAWLSPYPLLVLPVLLEEKAREARLYASRQAELYEASREWLSLAE